MKQNTNYIYGCLMGSAIGDALGAPIELMKYDKIIENYGEEGIKDLVIPYNQRAALVTDDTQLILFTAEGLIRSMTRAKRKSKERSVKGITLTLFRAYLRWLHTQGLSTPHWHAKDYDGWLVKVSNMQAYRDPGVTCLTALGKGVMGTIEKPLNDSKGCGGLVRVMPIGLIEDEETSFLVGMHSAATTHGSPNVYLSAGILALIIHYISQGLSISEGIEKALTYAESRPESTVLIKRFREATELAKEGNPTWEKIESLGKGFDADDVLCMALYSVLSYPNDIEKALKLGVNHSGDSDSVGAIVGGILGTYHGGDQLPTRWVEKIELKKEIECLARDLDNRYEEGEAWLKKYPAW